GERPLAAVALGDLADLDLVDQKGVAPPPRLASLVDPAAPIVVIDSHAAPLSPTAARARRAPARGAGDWRRRRRPARARPARRADAGGAPRPRRWRSSPDGGARPARARARPASRRPRARRRCPAPTRATPDAPAGRRSPSSLPAPGGS